MGNNKESLEAKKFVEVGKDTNIEDQVAGQKSKILFEKWINKKICYILPNVKIHNTGNG